MHGALISGIYNFYITLQNKKISYAIKNKCHYNSVTSLKIYTNVIFSVVFYILDKYCHS